jgi:hypothetical protein
MTVPADPYNFANGAVADADQVDARFAPLYAILAAGLTDDNIANDGISLGKLKPYAAMRHHSAPSQLMASNIGTANQIVFNTTDLDEKPSGESTQVSGNNLICREAGVYIVLASLAWDADVDGSRRSQIRQNGTSKFEEASQGSFDAHTIHNIVGLLTLADGDLIGLYGAHSAGGNLGPVSVGLAPFLAFIRVV